MSNFHFLLPEFRVLHEPAAGAELLVRSDPRAAMMRARHALEQVVLWLYENDRNLRMPYDKALNTLLTQPEFGELVLPHVFDKMRLIQRQGNQAVHSGRGVSAADAMGLARELFHVLFWLARTYTRASDPKALAADWSEQRVPFLVNADEAVEFTRDELKKQEAKFQAQLDAQLAALQQREQTVAAQAVTLAEREAVLARLDTELAQRRAELAQAKAAALATPDTHQYNEADTRRKLIDVLLAEAGWDLASAGDVSVEVPVLGMPNTQGEGAADYVLWAADGKPAAVVEAKRTMKDADQGRQQAKLYADGLETQHGCRPLIYYSNGHHTYFWDDSKAPPRKVQGFHSRDELALYLQRRHLQQNPRSLTVNSAIAGRPYQLRAIRAMVEALAAGRRRGLLTMATGTGKTRVAVALVDLLMRANRVKRVLFLADRTELVRQAANAFKTHLPDSSPVNLLLDRHGPGRVFVSTYPTMMGLIDEVESGRRRYGVGHFDLIIIDEAHRSVYQKYGAIFAYFDSVLVGLTATPRDEVDRDTYALFGLETGVPTDAYSLDEAVADGFLVPPKAYEVPLKFVREGIRYDELSAEEKEHWDSLDWSGLAAGDEGDPSAAGEPPDEVLAADINRKLFNQSTVDLMLQHLMQHGIKVDGGDTLGKTIIFAANQRHANFIAERFDQQYPHLAGHFARVITHAVRYAHSLIDDFKNPHKLPQIAISVDMLDTGIDVPEVVNLVFFKAVRSKVKFLQMIGRGTRLCPDLFGPGLHKSEFAIFDFCGNFEYFNQHPQGASASVAEPLGKRLFKQRLDLLALLREHFPVPVLAGEADLAYLPQRDPADEGEMQTALIDELHGEVAAMNPDNFIVRTAGEHVARFSRRVEWQTLDHAARADLRNHVAGLPSEKEAEHIAARLFDLLCVNLQLAKLRNSSDWPSLLERVIEIAAALEGKANVPIVQAELELIQAVQTAEYWTDITLPMLEHLRRHLRGLLSVLDEDRQSMKVVYTVLQDEIGAPTTATLSDYSAGVNLAQYRRKVEAFIRANENHVAIAKLKHARPLTATDLDELQRFFFSAPEVENQARLAEFLGEQSLPQFIRSLVGLDRAAAKERFARFLDGSRYNSQQIRFVEMIIERLAASGMVEPGQLYEAPFTGIHPHGLDGAFAGEDADAIVEVVREVGRLVA